MRKCGLNLGRLAGHLPIFTFAFVLIRAQGSGIHEAIGLSFVWHSLFFGIRSVAHFADIRSLAFAASKGRCLYSIGRMQPMEAGTAGEKDTVPREWTTAWSKCFICGCNVSPVGRSRTQCTAEGTRRAGRRRGSVYSMRSAATPDHPKTQNNGCAACRH